MCECACVCDGDARYTRSGRNYTYTCMCPLFVFSLVLSYARPMHLYRLPVLFNTVMSWCACSFDSFWFGFCSHFFSSCILHLYSLILSCIGFLDTFDNGWIYLMVSTLSYIAVHVTHKPFHMCEYHFSSLFNLCLNENRWFRIYRKFFFFLFPTGIFGSNSKWFFCRFWIFLFVTLPFFPHFVFPFIQFIMRSRISFFFFFTRFYVNCFICRYWYLVLLLSFVQFGVSFAYDNDIFQFHRILGIWARYIWAYSFWLTYWKFVDRKLTQIYWWCKGIQFILLNFQLSQFYDDLNINKNYLYIRQFWKRAIITSIEIESQVKSKDKILEMNTNQLAFTNLVAIFSLKSSNHRF